MKVVVVFDWQTTSDLILLHKAAVKKNTQLIHPRGLYGCAPHLTPSHDSSNKNLPVKMKEQMK